MKYLAHYIKPNADRQLIDSEIERANSQLHLTTSEKDLDKIASKSGFKGWQKLKQHAAKTVQQLNLTRKRAFAVGLNIEYKQVNWLAMLLSISVQLPYKNAVEKIAKIHYDLAVENFATEFSAAYKSVIIDGWKNHSIESIRNRGKELIHMESLFFLAQIMISFCLSSEITTADETLNGEWNIDFWGKDWTDNRHFLMLEKQLTEMFSESVSFDTLLNAFGIDGYMNWSGDDDLFCLYCWFNRYTTYLEKPQQYRQTMVFSAAFFFISFLNNKSEIVYEPRQMTLPLQRQTIQELMKLWGLL